MLAPLAIVNVFAHSNEQIINMMSCSIHDYVINYKTSRQCCCTNKKLYPTLVKAKLDKTSLTKWQNILL